MYCTLDVNKSHRQVSYTVVAGFYVLIYPSFENIKRCLTFFMHIVKPFVAHRFGYGLLSSSDQDIGLTEGVTGQQENLLFLGA